MNDYTAIRELEILERKWAMYVLTMMKSFGDSSFNSLYDYQCADEFLKEYPLPKAVETLVKLALGNDLQQLCFGACNNCGMHTALTNKAKDAVCRWGCPIPHKEPTVTEQKVTAILNLRKCTFKHPSLIACIKSGDHLTNCDDDGYCQYCGEQVEAPEPDDHVEEEELREPGALELSLTDNEPSFHFELAMTNDDSRAMRITSRPPKVDVGYSHQTLLCDEEDVSDLFKFTHDWLRAGNHELPLLELYPNSTNPPSVDIRATGKRTIGIHYDFEEDAYLIHALVGDGTWKGLASVPATEDAKQPVGFVCPECRSGPCYIDARDPAGYGCDHCDAFFILPHRPHNQAGDQMAKDEGAPPKDVLALPIPALLRAKYKDQPKEDDDDPYERLRPVIALGRPKDQTTLVGCVLNDVGKLVVASSLPGFKGMNEDD
jgi:hypothetical protein